MTSIELDEDQAQRMLIVQLAANALAIKPGGLHPGRPAPADDILKVAEWVYSGETDDDEVTVDEDAGFFENMDSTATAFGELFRAARQRAARRPSDAEIDAHMIKWAETEPDTADAIATEVFHPAKAGELRRGFLTRTWRIGAIDPALDGEGRGRVSVKFTDRLTGEKGVVFIDPETEEFEVVCGACTMKKRSQIRLEEDRAKGKADESAAVQAAYGDQETAHTN